MQGVLEQPWTHSCVDLKVLVRHATPRTVHYQQPGIFITPGGAIVAFAALDDNPSSLAFEFGGTQSQAFRSTDAGKTWTASSVFTGYGSEMFAVGTDLYWVHMDTEYGAIKIAKSTDDGVTFGTAVQLLASGGGDTAPNYYVVPAIPLITGGRVYFTTTDTPDPSLFANGTTVRLLHASTSSDLMSAGSWTHSGGVVLSGGVTTGDAHVGFFEPQLILDRDDNAKIISRVKSDLRMNLSGVIDVTLGASASLSYNTSTGLRTMTGGHVLFRVGICPVTDKYLAIVTRNTIGNSTADYYNQRTIVSLISSDDLTTWTHVADLIRAANYDTLYKALSEGYQYMQWLFDGNDIIGVIRTGEHIISINHHQASAVYFFRIRNYYANLLAPAPTNSGASPTSPYSAVTRNGQVA